MSVTGVLFYSVIFSLFLHLIHADFLCCVSIFLFLLSWPVLVNAISSPYSCWFSVLYFYVSFLVVLTSWPCWFVWLSISGLAACSFVSCHMLGTLSACAIKPYQWTIITLISCFSFFSKNFHMIVSNYYLISPFHFLTWK